MALDDQVRGSAFARMLAHCQARLAAADDEGLDFYE
jgi:hypothetical protein